MIWRWTRVWAQPHVVHSDGRARGGKITTTAHHTTARWRCWVTGATVGGDGGRRRRNTLWCAWDGLSAVEWRKMQKRVFTKRKKKRILYFELTQVFNWDMFLNKFLYSSTLSSKKVLSSDDKDKSQFYPRWTFLYYCVFWLCALNCAFP